MSALRILHAIRSDGFAGVEQFVVRLAGEQAASGHTVTVIGGDPQRMRPPLDAAGVTHITATDHTRAVMRAVSAHAGEADIVNSHMTAADVAAATALAPRRHAPPLVATRHFASPRGRIGPVRIDSLIGRRIDAEISISESVATAIRRRSTVVHPGVAVRPEVDPGARGRSILVAQRLQPEKRTEVALAAYAASGLNGDGWRLLIAGEGANRDELMTLAADLGVAEDVTFLGFRTDVADLMDAAGLLLAPAEFEHFGLTVLEAMASGLPVVASDAGGHRELLSGLDPRALFPVDDIEVAAHSLRAMADDADARDRLGAAERERQQRAFTLTAQAAATEAVYREAIARRKTA